MLKNTPFSEEIRKGGCFVRIQGYNRQTGLE